jgi:dynein heavy chain
MLPALMLASRPPLAGELANVEPMYQYSLAWYVALFKDTIARAEKSRELAKRIEALQGHFTYSLYCKVCRWVLGVQRCPAALRALRLLLLHHPSNHLLSTNQQPNRCHPRSLFEKDKLLFSLLLCVAIKAHISRSLDLAQFRFLLTGGISTAALPPNPSAWLSDKSWAELCRLAESFPGHFQELPAAFAANQAPWRAIYDAADPAAAQWPQPLTAQLDSFQRLLLLRVFRPDKLVSGVQSYVTEVSAGAGGHSQQAPSGRIGGLAAGCGVAPSPHRPTCAPPARPGAADNGPPVCGVAFL